MLLVQVIIDGLVGGSVYALGALGFNLIYGTTGTFHIAFGVLATLAVYVGATIGITGWAGVGAFLVSVPTATLLGLVVYLLIYRPMESRGRSRTIVFVASLGLAIIVENVITLVWGALPKQFSFPAFLNSQTVGSYRISIFGATAIGLALLALLALYGLFRTPIGRQLRAVAVNLELAEVVGVAARRVVLAAYLIGSLLGAVGMFGYSLQSSLRADIGTPYTLVIAIAAIAGGVGNPLGAYVLALIFGVIEGTSTVYISGQWTLVLVYGVFIVLILARPNGVFRGLSRLSS
jgi:branched-chain amino acid transport system permease protein